MDKITKGLIITFPYATYIKDTNKSIIIKSRNFKTISNKKMLLIEDKIGLGIIELEDPEPIDLIKFKKLFNKHLITEADRILWWKNYTTLYKFNISYFKKFSKVILLDYGNGPQVTINITNILYKNIFIGTSGFIVAQNKYPFNSVEINYSFYKYPTSKFIENLSKLNLTYSIKVNQIITHYKQLLDVEQLWLDFYNIFIPIKHKIKCFLFQFSSRFIPNENTFNKIKNFSKLLNKDHTYVFEFRNDKWFTKENIEIINRLDILVCSLYAFNANFFNILNKTFYIRFHGNTKMFRGSYNNDQLTLIYNYIKKNRISNSYVYFNNTMQNAAFQNAITFTDFFNIINLPLPS